MMLVVGTGASSSSSSSSSTSSSYIEAKRRQHCAFVQHACCARDGERGGTGRVGSPRLWTVALDVCSQVNRRHEERDGLCLGV